jgi:hypothetical protein
MSDLIRHSEPPEDDPLMKEIWDLWKLANITQRVQKVKRVREDGSWYKLKVWPGDGSQPKIAYCDSGGFDAAVAMREGS